MFSQDLSLPPSKECSSRDPVKDNPSLTNQGTLQSVESIKDDECLPGTWSAGSRTESQETESTQDEPQEEPPLTPAGLLALRPPDLVR